MSQTANQKNKKLNLFLKIIVALFLGGGTLTLMNINWSNQENSNNTTTINTKIESNNPTEIYEATEGTLTQNGNFKSGRNDQEIEGSKSESLIVKGIVQRKLSLKPVSNAKIYYNNDEIGLTNHDGRFKVRINSKAVNETVTLSFQYDDGTTYEQLVDTSEFENVQVKVNE